MYNDQVMCKAIDLFKPCACFSYLFLVMYFIIVLLTTWLLKISNTIYTKSYLRLTECTDIRWNSRCKRYCCPGCVKYSYYRNISNVRGFSMNITY